MSLHNGPVRPGARGGRDQFSWDNVKSDKDREFYLGHSVKATTGRWQKGRDVYWYTRDVKDPNAVIQDELAAVKQREEEVMLEALGLKPKTVRLEVQPQLDQKELADLLKRGGKEGDAGGVAADADRVKGLGFTPNAVPGEAVHTTLPGIGAFADGPGTRAPAALPGQPPGASGSIPAVPPLSAAQLQQLQRIHKKAAKKAKKAAKKAQKGAKRSKQKDDLAGREPAPASKVEGKHVGSASPGGSSSSSESEAAAPNRAGHHQHTSSRHHRRAIDDGSSRHNSTHSLPASERVKRRRSHSPPQPQSRSRPRHDSPVLLETDRQEGGRHGWQDYEPAEHRRRERANAAPTADVDGNRGTRDSPGRSSLGVRACDEKRHRDSADSPRHHETKRRWKHNSPPRDARHKDTSRQPHGRHDSPAHDARREDTSRQPRSRSTQA